MFTKLINFYCNYQIAIFPVMSMLIITQIPFVLRRMRRQYYIPIYVNFLISDINVDLAKYYLEYDMGEDSFEWSEEEVAELKNNLKTKAVFSTLLTVFITPLYCGFLSAFLLPLREFIFYIIVLTIYRIYGSYRAILDFSSQRCSSSTSVKALGVIYFLYVLSIPYLTYQYYIKSKPLIVSRDYWGILDSVFQYFHSNIFSAIILCVICYFFSDMIANPLIRKQKVEERKEMLRKINEKR